MGGILEPLMCDPNSLDHGITLVGYGVGKTILGDTKDFWWIKNSWGASWGESGYLRLLRGEGTCGVNSTVSSSYVK